MGGCIGKWCSVCSILTRKDRWGVVSMRTDFNIRSRGFRQTNADVMEHFFKVWDMNRPTQGRKRNSSIVWDRR